MDGLSKAKKPDFEKNHDTMKRFELRRRKVPRTVFQAVMPSMERHHNILLGSWKAGDLSTKMKRRNGKDWAAYKSTIRLSKITLINYGENPSKRTALKRTPLQQRQRRRCQTKSRGLCQCHWTEFFERDFRKMIRLRSRVYCAANRQRCHLT